MICGMVNYLMMLDSKEKRHDLSIQSLESDMIVFENLYQNNIVGIVDIVNSTRIISKLTPKQACQYYAIFHNSLSYVIRSHHASVVKNIGDGILFYFPNLKLANDALSCGIDLLNANYMINEIFKNKKIPQIKYRISMDYGPLMIAKCKLSSTKDIFGPTVNLCSKINHFASPNQLVVGGDLYEIVKKTKYKFRQVTHFHSALKQNYPVYSLE